jgi:hypothetical protein
MLALIPSSASSLPLITLLKTDEDTCASVLLENKAIPAQSKNAVCNVFFISCKLYLTLQNSAYIVIKNTPSSEIYV